MFYTFIQNNSGGTFESNENIREYVIIEAASADDANERAERVGVYFDGCDTGDDCSCCGDRWYRAWRDDCGTDGPTIYGEPVHNADGGIFRKGCIVYYMDGRKEAVDLR